MKKKLLIAVLCVAGLAVLAGAAFFAMRLVNGGLSGATGPGGLVALGGNGDRASISIEKAEESPDREADLIGELVEKADNRLTVQQFVGMEGPGSSAGPKLEVVVSSDTQVYRDATLDSLSEPPGESQTLEQILEPSTADEMETGAMLMVWGEKRGDRLIAEFLIHSQGKVIRGAPPQ